MGKQQEQFLRRACASAREARHLFPEFAACEAALESAWGLSKLAARANNLFGQKQPHAPAPGSAAIALPTCEYIHDKWVVVRAMWMAFPDWVTCFRERMQLLERLRGTYSHYEAALKAQSGEEFIEEVSHTWSTDPRRAGKVLSIHALYRSNFGLVSHAESAGED